MAGVLIVALVFIGCVVIVGVSIGSRYRQARKSSIWCAEPAPVASVAVPERDERADMLLSESGDPREQLAEAIACWRLRLPDSRIWLVEAAGVLLVAGDGHPAVIDLASLYPDENSFVLDALVDRVVVELELQNALVPEPDTIAIRRMCRSVLSGAMPPRELARWAHIQFHHESDSNLVNDFAEIDDEYDSYGWTSVAIPELNFRTREIAASLLREPLSF